MARATWSGSISFGLVNVPVKLYSAVQHKDVHFHQLQEKTGGRIRYKKVSESSGREVSNDDIVKAYEISDGNYVPMSDEDFVPASDIDGLPVRARPNPREVKMAEELIDSLTVKWSPKKYHDTYREQLLDIIKRKAKGEEIVTEPREKRAEVVDLMAALEASIEANKSRRKRRTKKSA